MEIVKAQNVVSRLHNKIEVMLQGFRDPWYDTINKKIYVIDSATRKELWRGTLSSGTWNFEKVMSNAWMFSGGIFTMSGGSHLGFVSDSGYLIKIAPDFQSIVSKSDEIRSSPINVSLAMAESNGVIMFGEYSDRKRIWRSTDQGDTWTVSLFDSVVRHWHSIQVDPYTGHWWAASGDAGLECKIVKSEDDGLTWTTVAEDSQDLRAIGFVFKEKEILWASDANAIQSRAMKSVRTPFAPTIIGDIPGVSYGNVKTIDGRMLFNIYVETASVSHDDTFLCINDGVTTKELLRFNMIPGVNLGGIDRLTNVDNENRVWATVRDTRLGTNVLVSIIIPFDTVF